MLLSISTGLHNLTAIFLHSKTFLSPQKILSEAPWCLQWWKSACQCRRHGFNPLIWRDPTCPRAAKPVPHCCWACALEPRETQVLSPYSTVGEATAVRGPCSSKHLGDKEMRLLKKLPTHQQPSSSSLLVPWQQLTLPPISTFVCSRHFIWIGTVGIIGIRIWLLGGGEGVIILWEIVHHTSYSSNVTCI